MARFGPRPKPLADRFWPKVQRTEGCWLWTAATRGTMGYGAIGVPGRGMQRAHRISWEMANGPIPTGLEVLHRCDTPRCVRPDHLFLGTAADNNADMAAKNRRKRDRCKNGHALVEGNLRLFRRANGTVGRECLTCDRADQRRYQQAKRRASTAGGGQLLAQALFLGDAYPSSRCTRVVRNAAIFWLFIATLFAFAYCDWRPA